MGPGGIGRWPQSLGLQTSFQTFFLGGWGEGDGVPVARSHRLDVPQRGQIPTRPCHPVAPAGSRPAAALVSSCRPRAFLRGNSERLSHRRGGEARGRPAARAPHGWLFPPPGTLPRLWGHLRGLPGAVAPNLSQHRCWGSPGRSIGRPICGAGFCPRTRRSPFGTRGVPNPAPSPLFL